MSEQPPPCPQCGAPTYWLTPRFSNETVFRRAGAVGGWASALVLVGVIAAPFPFTLPAIAALAAAGACPALGYKGGEKLGRAMDDKQGPWCKCTNQACDFSGEASRPTAAAY